MLYQIGFNWLISLIYLYLAYEKRHSNAKGIAQQVCNLPLGKKTKIFNVSVMQFGNDNLDWLQPLKQFSSMCHNIYL